jgi:hypothetical protein
MFYLLHFGKKKKRETKDKKEKGEVVRDLFPRADIH